MAKRKRPSGSIQRRRSDEPYNVGYFARKHDISLEQARELMRTIGRDRGQTQRGRSKAISQVEATAANAAS